MKIQLAFHAGFSMELVWWNATLIVGGRGSVHASWTDADGVAIERDKQRHDFRLRAEVFEAVVDTLRRLPEIAPLVVDDAPSRHIECLGAAPDVRCSRVLWTSPAEAEFEHAWSDLVAAVLPVLLELGVPPGKLPELSQTAMYSSRAAMKILFVENHRVFADTVSAAFLPTHDVVVVPTVHAALAEVDRVEYDLALVDYDLDDAKGDEFVRGLRSAGSKLPVVAVSSHADGNDALVRAGADAICMKTEFASISRVLDELLAKWSSIDELTRKD